MYRRGCDTETKTIQTRHQTQANKVKVNVCKLQRAFNAQEVHWHANIRFCFFIPNYLYARHTCISKSFASLSIPVKNF